VCSSQLISGSPASSSNSFSYEDLDLKLYICESDKAILISKVATQFFAHNSLFVSKYSLTVTFPFQTPGLANSLSS
jgi:hypothetical protein